MALLYVGADHDLTLTGLVQAADGVTYLNSATVGWNLKDRHNVSLATGTLTYTPGSNGDYTGILQSTVTDDMVAGTLYYLEYTISQSTYQDYRRIPYRAAYREET